MLNPDEQDASKPRDIINSKALQIPLSALTITDHAYGFTNLSGKLP